MHFFCSSHTFFIPWTCTIPQPPEGSWQPHFHTADGHHAAQPWDQAWKRPHRFGRAAPESGPAAPGFPEERADRRSAVPSTVAASLHLYMGSGSPYLIVEFLQKGNLFLQGLHFTLKVKTSQRSIVNILFWTKKRWNMEDAQVYGLSHLF